MTISVSFSVTCDFCGAVVISDGDPSLPAGWRVCWLAYGLRPGFKAWGRKEFTVCRECQLPEKSLLRKLYDRLKGAPQ